jgi:hypothetical protein
MGHKINGGVNYGPRCLTTGAGDRCCCEGYEGLIAEQGKCEPTSCALTPGGWHVTWAVTAAALSDGRPVRTRTIGRAGATKAELGGLLAAHLAPPALNQAGGDDRRRVTPQQRITVRQCRPFGGQGQPMSGEGTSPVYRRRAGPATKP